MRTTFKLTAILLPMGMLFTPGAAFSQILPGQIVLPKSVAKVKPSAKSDNTKWYLKAHEDRESTAPALEKYVPQVEAYRTEAPLLGNVDISTTNQFTRYEGQSSSVFDRKIRETNAVDPESYILKARTRW